MQTGHKPEETWRRFGSSEPLSSLQPHYPALDLTQRQTNKGLAMVDWEPNTIGRPVEW